MTRPSRRLHRHAFLLLSFLLPAVFVAGLMARRPLVQVEPPTDRINLMLADGTEMIYDAREIWGSAVDAPDVLVYWVEQRAEVPDLPSDALLLGSLESGRRGVLRVPEGRERRGYLILYSLAYQSVVAEAAVPKEMR